MEKKNYVEPRTLVLDIEVESTMLEGSMGTGTGLPGDVGEVNRRLYFDEEDEEEYENEW